MQYAEERAQNGVLNILDGVPDDPQGVAMLLGNMEERAKYGKIARFMDSRAIMMQMDQHYRIDSLERTVRTLVWGVGILLGIAGILVWPYVSQVLG